ncbi:MAG: HAD-IIIA family hydrolase, partial [Prevotella sp.]|nr:HAD-IIIA family hydrolase [Prevotella sp.]
YYSQQLANSYKYIFIVSNQKCVGKGMLSLEQLEALHEYIISRVCEYGGRIDDIFSAVSNDMSSLDYKPNIGLSVAMKKKYPDIDFSRALMIGDSFSDYLFAKRIGSQFICY